MSFTTTFTSKGQLTVPKAVRDKIGYRPGLQVDIFVIEDENKKEISFIAKVRQKSSILQFAGDLASRDDKKPLSKIREIAQKRAASQKKI